MLLSLDGLKGRAGLTSTDAARDASLSMILADVDAAIRKAIRPYLPEPVTLTDVILPTSVGPVLDLPCVPVRSVTSLYLNLRANGVAANFEAEHLLTAGADYLLEIDQQPEGHSRAGSVRRLNASSWGFRRRFPPTRLAAGLEPVPGAVKVTFAAGPASVPSDLAHAAFLMTTLMYDRRERGGPLASESWGGRSESVAGPFTATAALTSPDVAELLKPYQTVRIGVA